MESFNRNIFKENVILRKTQLFMSPSEKISDYIRFSKISIGYFGTKIRIIID